MFVARREFEVKPGSEELFEKAYGRPMESFDLFMKDYRYCRTGRASMRIARSDG